MDKIEHELNADEKESHTKYQEKIESTFNDTKKQLDEWWKSSEKPKRIQSISNEKKTTLRDTDKKVGVQNGKYVNLDEVGSIFEISSGDDRIFFKKRNIGVYHIYNQKYPEKYILFFPEKNEIEDFDGRILSGRHINEVLIDRIGVSGDISFQVLRRKTSNGDFEFSIGAFSQNEDLDVRNSGKKENTQDQQEHMKLESIYVKDRLDRGEFIDFPPQVEIPVHLEIGTEALDIQNKKRSKKYQCCSFSLSFTIRTTLCCSCSSDSS